MLSTFNKKIILILIISAGVLFRVYNVSFDDLWYDEIISFWVANPNFTYNQTNVFHSQIEDAPIFYNLILKTYFQIFGYSVFNGRFFSAFFGILSILSIIYLDKKLNKKNNSYLFSAFLISFNIYLIGYSQEIRNYSLFFFITTLSLIFFIKIIEDKKNIKLLLIFSTILLFNVLLHPFGLVIFFSLAFYLFLEFIIKKNFSFSILSAFVTIFILFAFFYYQLFSITTNTEADYYWFMENPSLSFYTNFHFSKYFGSRLVGGIFLITLIYLISKNFKKIIEINHYTLFLILIIFSYLIPILHGYLFNPIFLPRYTMWNLIPIILLFSGLTFNFEKKKQKFIIIFILSFITIGNHFTEQTIKQFYQMRTPSKPEYSKAVKFISMSNTKNYAVKIENLKNNEASLNAIKNYIQHLNKDLILVEIDNKNQKKIKFWFLCPLDINTTNCALPKNIKKKFKSLEQKQFNSIVLNLVEIDK